MTGIAMGSFIEASKTGELGVHSLDTFVMQVPSFRRAQEFFTSFGLDIREEGRTLTLRTFGNHHVWATLVEGERRKLQYLSFGAYAEDLPRFKSHLERLGIRLMDGPPGFESNGLWFRGHDDMLIEIKAAAKTTLDSKALPNFVSAPAGNAALGSATSS